MTWSYFEQLDRVRRAALEDLDLHGPALRTTPASMGEGLAMVRATKECELEGVVAKRLGPDRSGPDRTG
jgi:ATP-dependent DNA ligase